MQIIFVSVPFCRYIYVFEINENFLRLIKISKISKIQLYMSRRLWHARTKVFLIIKEKLEETLRKIALQ